MRKSRFSETQIVGILRDAESGVPVPDLLRTHGVSKAHSSSGGASTGARRCRMCDNCGSSRLNTPSSSGCTRTWRWSTRPSRMSCTENWVLAPFAVGDVTYPLARKGAYATEQVAGAISGRNLLHRNVLTSQHQQRTAQAPIHGELLKLGIAIAEATVGHYMVRRRPPPSQTWRTFLTNHIGQLVSVDFFVVPTLTFRVLFVFVVLAHDRRQILHVNVTGYPTAAWTAQQIRNAFPWDTAPRFLLRDRDGTYGHNFRACLEAMEIDEVLTAPQSPWQNPYVERLIGSMRRECVDHVIVLNERSLHRILRSYIDYYHLWRTHLSLGKDAPVSRRVEPAAPGEVMAMPHVGGLHHSYHRHAA